MKKKKIIIISILLLSNLLLYGQTGSWWRSDILNKSNDSVLRVSVVDSIVNESFWDTRAGYMRWYREMFRKTDFSENAKKTLLSYFDRTLPKTAIDRAKQNAINNLNFDIEKLRLEAEKKGLDYDSLYNVRLEKQINKNIGYISADARNRVSPLYARLLGWLDYKPAIPVLEAVLTDNLKNEGYATDNKVELALSCKLALARMGNKKYEKELIDYYKNMDMDCNNDIYKTSISNLLYINTRNSINLIIKLSDTDIKFSRPFMYV